MTPLRAPITVPRLLVHLVLGLACFHGACSHAPLAGSGTEEGNVVTGTVVDTAGNVSPGALVALIPAGFNPVTERTVPGSLTDTSDASGTYRIIIRDTGRYTLQVDHPQKRTKSLVTDIKLHDDTTHVVNAVLKKPGSIRVFVPVSMSGAKPTAFFKGTTIVRNVAISSGSDPSIYMDSLPEAVLPALYYADKNDVAAYHRLTDTVRVMAGDTGEIDAFSFWQRYTGTGSGLVFNKVIDMVIAADGTKWFALFDQGIVSFNGAQWTEFDDNNSLLPSSAPRNIALQDNGTIWASFYKGVASYSKGTWTAFTQYNSGIPSDGVTQVACGRGDTIWVGTQDSGAVRFDGITWKRYDTLSSPLPSNQINSICIDGKTGVWFATPKGAVKYDGTSWSTYDQTSADLFSDYVWKVFIDAEENLWCTHEGGVSVKRGSSWTAYGGSDCELLRNPVWNMAQDRDARYWFLTDKGMASFDGEAWKVFGGKRHPLLDNIEIYKIAEDGNGNKWICTGGRGIVVLGSTITDPFNGLP